MKSVLVHCWRGGNPVMNLGEWFNELLLAKLGYGIRYWPNGRIERDEPPLMLIGSDFCERVVNKLLSRARAVWVWGQGNGKEWETPVNPQDYGGRVHVHALRGPITAEGSGAANVPLCDPGWLMPWALPIERRPSGEVLYVPHWEQYKGRDANEVNVLMKRESLMQTIERIVNADFVLTSTLHTMIMCLAYGTPCALHLAGKLNMPQKWRDVFGAVPPHCATIKEGWSWWLGNGVGYRHLQQTEALLRAFPHQIAR